MQVKITDKGFANFTGHFGPVEFNEGVSVEISSADAERLGSIISVEVVGTGENPSTTQRMVDLRNKNMEEMGGSETSLEELTRQAQEAAAKALAEAANKPVIDVTKVVKEPGAELDWTFTKEDLSTLVSKGGIGLLRNFAEPYGVKGTAVAKIIAGLLELKELNSKPAQEPEVIDPEPEVIDPEPTPDLNDADLDLDEPEVIEPEPAPVVVQDTISTRDAGFIESAVQDAPTQE